MTGMNNTIHSDMDIDGFITVFTDRFAEALTATAEGCTFNVPHVFREHTDARRPGALKMKIKNQNETVSLVSEGELNILKARALRSWASRCSSPARRTPSRSTRTASSRPITF